MPQVGFDYSGKAIASPNIEEFNASIGRDFYSSDTKVITHQSDIRLTNARTLAGYIPICMHQSQGVSTTTRRSWKQVRNNSSDVYLIWIPVCGSVTICQGGRTAVVEPGNIALSSSIEPLCIGTAPNGEQKHQSFQILAPAHLVNRALNEPKQFCGVSFSDANGGAFIARDVLLSLYNHAESMSRESAESLATAGIEAIFRAINPPGSDLYRTIGVKETKLRRLLDYLQLHYCDPELSTEKVATACGISMRYLHYLLKSKGISFYDYLWSTRLNSAFDQLNDSSLTNRTIAEIAYSVGFKSSPHFSRAFRNEYSCSPKEMRQRLCSGDRANCQTPCLSGEGNESNDCLDCVPPVGSGQSRSQMTRKYRN
jgi:AraC-like DNA-binding protein